MKILAVSDKVIRELVEHPETLLQEKPDIILACGDLPPEYLTDLRQQHNVPLYFIEGNHDLRYQETQPIGCININGTVRQEQGLTLLGFSGSRWYNGGINQYSETEMKKIVRGLWFTLLQHRQIDIVISHAPPRFIHDREDPCHRGFRIFTTFIQKQRPAFFIHGHIHDIFAKPANRITTINDTRVINSYGFFFFDTEMAAKAAAEPR